MAVDDETAATAAALCPHLIEDYPLAVVRIATLRAEKKQHMLFAWIELYPFDMHAPSGWSAGKKPWTVPGSDGWTLGFCARKLPTGKAVDWYMQAAAGDINIAVGTDQLVRAVDVSLVPEPALGSFVVADDVPFAARWHDQPRVHRLVRLDAINSAIQELGHSKAARNWLEAHLGFDIFRREDWLGSIAVLAPDPICASFEILPAARTADGRETLSLQATPRRGQNRSSDLTTVTVHVMERRAGELSSIRSANLPADGGLTLEYPQSTDHIGWAAVCAERGLLRAVEPTPRVELLHLQTTFSRGQTSIEVPSGGRRKPPQSYIVPTQVSSETSTVGEAMPVGALSLLKRYKGLRERRRADAAAPQILLGTLSDATEAENALAKREAQAFVSELAAGARNTLIFVDPYFGLRELKLFGFRNHGDGVIRRVLTGWDVLGAKQLNDEISSPPPLQGALIIQALDELDEELKERRPEIRVMPGGGRPVVHDRYMVVDDAVWHCGPSFNELGDRLGVMVRLPNPVPIREMIGRVWEQSELLRDHMLRRMAEDGDDQG